jgi:hypothetical protein
MGDNTHHQDQSISPINLRMMNTMVNRPQKPIPPLEDVEVPLIA